MTARAIATLGLISFGLIVVAGLIEPLWLAPDTTSTSREIAAYVGDNRDGFLWSIFGFGLGMGMFLAFAAALWAWLKERPGVNEGYAAIFALGSASLATAVYVGFTPAFVLAYRAPDVTPARELWDLSFGVLAMSGIPTALALGAYAAIVLSARPLPVWTAWVAILGAVAHVLAAASFLFREGFFSLEGGVIVVIPITLFLFILATSVALLLEPRRP